MTTLVKRIKSKLSRRRELTTDLMELIANDVLCEFVVASSHLGIEIKRCAADGELLVPKRHYQLRVLSWTVGRDSVTIRRFMPGNQPPEPKVFKLGFLARRGYFRFLKRALIEHCSEALAELVWCNELRESVLPKPPEPKVSTLLTDRWSS